MSGPNQSGRIRAARAIVVADGAGLLIERRRAGRHYWVFPGGKLEPGETPQEALVREVEEETGLRVRPTWLVAEVAFPDRIQTFWLASITGGDFGTGTGPEMTGGEPASLGTYRPVWRPLAEIDRSAVYPERIAAELVARRDGAWPEEPIRFEDPFVWWT